MSDISDEEGNNIVINTGLDLSGLLEYLTRLEIEKRDKALLSEVSKKTISKVAMAAIHQGIWTAISYFSETNKDDALGIAKLFGLPAKRIHEFDWERLEESYGSKARFEALYNVNVTPISVAESASSLVEEYLVNRNFFAGDLSSSDEDRIFGKGIVIGSSMALGVINTINSTEALGLSEILSADIGVAA